MSDFLPIALQGTAVDPFKLPQEYNNVLATAANIGKTQAETATEQQRPGLVQAQTVGAQIQNELNQLGLMFKQYGFSQATAPANSTEALPGQGAGSGYAPASSGAPGTLSAVTGQAESGNDYGAVNAQGYSGKYQMGKAALVSAGIYQPAPHEDLTAQQPGDWWGTFNVPGMGQMTYQQWLSSPQAQEASWGAHVGNLNQEIQQRGLSRYIGQTVAGVPITQDSLLSMMHGGGPQGTQRFLESGGQYNPADANGQTIADFGQRTARPYQVAGGWQAPPGGQGANPLAAATSGGPVAPNQLDQTNPMATSQAGVVYGGVAVNRQKYAMAFLSGDPAKALNDLLSERRNTIAAVAGETTDPQSWNQAVAQLWRQGYLTNGEFQHFYGQFSPQLRDQVVRSQGSAESQTGFQTAAMGHGLVIGQGGQPQLDPRLLASHDPIKINEPVTDPRTGQVTGSREITYPAVEYYRRYGGLPEQGFGPAAQGGGGGSALPVAAGAPPGAGAAPTAAGAAPPAGGAPSGLAAVPGAPATSVPPVAGAPGLPPGALGAGKVELNPQEQANLDIQKKAQETAITNAGEQAKGVAQAYGDQAGTIIKNGMTAPVTLERLQALETAANEFRTSPSGQLRAAAFGHLQDALQTAGFGVPDWLNAQTEGAAVINKLGGFLAANMVKSMGERAARVFDSIKQIQPNIEQTTGGYQAVLNSIRMDAMRDRDLATYQDRWLADPSHNGSIAGMNDSFNKANPIEAYASRVLPSPFPKSAAEAVRNVVYRLPDHSIAVWTGSTFQPVPKGASAPPPQPAQ